MAVETARCKRHTDSVSLSSVVSLRHSKMTGRPSSTEEQKGFNGRLRCKSCSPLVVYGLLKAGTCEVIKIQACKESLKHCFDQVSK